MTGGAKRILVAEDSAANRELITEILELNGYETTIADDGGAAVERLRQRTYDLVLLDIQMPMLDGYQVMEQMRAHHEWATIPVVALTAYAMQGDREHALRAGFDDYVTKPIDFQVLLSTIERLLLSKDLRSSRRGPCGTNS
jgi:CheY-like chemotaxis protein